TAHPGGSRSWGRTLSAMRGPMSLQARAGLSRRGEHAPPPRRGFERNRAERIPDENERRPDLRREAGALAEQVELGRAQRLGLALAGGQMPVEGGHELGRAPIVDVPETADDRARAGLEEGLREALHAFAREDFPARRLTGREHDEIARETQAADLLRFETGVT